MSTQPTDQLSRRFELVPTEAVARSRANADQGAGTGAWPTSNIATARRLYAGDWREAEERNAVVSRRIGPPESSSRRGWLVTRRVAGRGGYATRSGLRRHPYRPGAHPGTTSAARAATAPRRRRRARAAAVPPMRPRSCPRRVRQPDSRRISRSAAGISSGTTKPTSGKPNCARLAGTPVALRPPSVARRSCVDKPWDCRSSGTATRSRGMRITD